MPPDSPVTLADIYQLVEAERRTANEQYESLRNLIGEEHRITSEKLEVVRAEGREREREIGHKLSGVEVSLRTYVDNIHKEIKQGVENETTCLQSGLSGLHKSLFGNGDMEKSFAFRLKAIEDVQARWTKISNRILVGIGIPLTLGILGLLWLLLIGKAQIILH